MRVSTTSTYLNGLTAMQQLQQALDYTQRQISSGRKILTPSDDPIAASRSIEMRESIGRLKQFDRNSNIATNRLSQEETTLGSVNNAMQRIRELALQANNATQSNETRGMIAVEMRDHLNYLVQLANQKDGNGHYLFSGSLSDVEPVSRSGSAFAYNGDQAQRMIQIAEGREIADGDNGADVFFRIRAGNGDFTARAVAGNTGTGIVSLGSLVDPTLWDQDSYTLNFIDPANYEVRDSGGGLVASGAYQAGDRITFRGVEFSISGVPATGDQFTVVPSPHQDMFTSIERLVSTIEQSVFDDPSRAALTNGVNAGLQNLDEAIGNVLDIRTQIGSRLSIIESQVDNNGAMTLTMQETLASIEDLDYAEALSRLSLQITTLEAAQKSFVNTQQLSLFNYF